MKKLRNCVLCFIMACSILMLNAMPAYAAKTINIKKNVKFTISYKKDETLIVGATVDIYRVADVDANANMTLIDSFSGCPVQIENLNQSDWDVLATTLQSYVWSNSLSSDIHRKTNKKGEVAASLKPGLYLVMIDQYTQGKYTYSATPFMAFLPGFNEEKNVWNYNVTAYPKVSAVDSSDHIYSYLEGENPTEDSSESPKSNGDHSDSIYSNPVSENPTEDSSESLASKDAPSDSILPQTGLLWWPVLPLFAIGLLFLVIGLFRRRGRED